MVTCIGRRPRRGSVHRHRLVVKTAREMAHSLYEDVMRDNAVYASWKRVCPELTPEFAQGKFVELLVPHLLEPARATLAGMLSSPAHSHLHDTIFDALIKDASLRRRGAH